MLCVDSLTRLDSFTVFKWLNKLMGSMLFKKWQIFSAA
jgi:hypothetical protein